MTILVSSSINSGTPSVLAMICSMTSAGSALLWAIRQSASPARVIVTAAGFATVTVDVYEDFLCPICGTFEKTYGTDIKKAVEDGKVKVRYHILPMLNRLSSPEGYSTDSANAALCVADDGKFNAFHAALFAKQPEEGEAGYTKDQLIKLGKDVGVTSASFESCVQNTTYKTQLDELMSKTSNDPVLKDAETGRFRGTPSVASGGKMVDLDNKNWLADLTK